ncbi:ABC transporter permease [Mobiluncus mulieris]|uniref:Transport permease protein n=1 Tax=Mobiluncus mulieris TaxID=2052 RepID=A0A848RMN2_9ACTO|nr:ABC transporter permease [Mobiluncus mulieris]MCU9971746.1 ABC transporter permease [Mobiluncus mulieris]MCV0002590.1 ABC transporter permease [Mobiluncus mulieris]NMW63353.1 ABC transporter permease [Mobiluncus mulieris]NMW90178.1 ABC transporter permease [Mobiluncus mulieris]NMW92725.1 ABC transporter permease [Mobiluncus mulieris]
MKLATVSRINAQLRHDPRTVALVLVVPALLLTLLYFVFVDVQVPPGAPAPFDRIGSIMLAVLPMLMMFIITSVVMLRERTMGTLERLLTTPVSRWNLIGSYALVFSLLALAQAVILEVLILGVFGVEIEGSWWTLLLVAVGDALLGVSFGLLASSFATTEFQAVQFMPVFIGPQLLLCGLFAPVDSMPDVLEVIARCLPMTWAADVVNTVIEDDTLAWGEWIRLGGLFVVSLAVLFLASLTMKRTVK